MQIKDRLLGSFLGLAIGDAVGTTVEFRARDTFEPVTDMVGKGPFNLPAGYFTDDTSMALCLAESLIEYPFLDRNDLLSRFSKWYREGVNSPTGRCFDIGATTSSAIVNWEKNGSVLNNTGPWDAGNGSIMRLAPAVIKYHDDRDRAIATAIMQGETTHGSVEACDSCDLLARVLLTAYVTDDKNAVLNVDAQDGWADSVKNILKTLDVSRDEVKSSGYVIHTLHAALWCFKNTDNFRDAILLATNLGEDADTVAAVTGQIAGAFYGMSGIPILWLDKLYETGRFIELVDKLTNE
jgi:ADP-ribosyl-[dinitrogen reductase] hydrolase